MKKFIMLLIISGLALTACNQTFDFDTKSEGSNELFEETESEDTVD